MILLGAAAVGSLGAAAQERRWMRQIGVLMGTANDAEGQSRLTAFVQRLQELGWTEGHNVRIDYRWTSGRADLMRPLAKEIVELQPDVILGHTTPVVAALLEETRATPIVFVAVSDPVGSGFVGSLARPGGNITGFTNIESSMAGKWLELLKEIAPRITRIALMFNPDTSPGGGSYFLRPFEAAAPSFAAEPIAAPVHDAAEIEGAVAALGRVPGGGLIANLDIFIFNHRDLIVELAARHRVPAIYPLRDFVTSSGLISYGADTVDLFRRAPSYVDRALKGAKPADLPVQAPTKFELVINLKTAKALGLDVPPRLLARADEVIE